MVVIIIVHRKDFQTEVVLSKDWLSVKDGEVRALGPTGKLWLNIVINNTFGISQVIKCQI